MKLLLITAIAEFGKEVKQILKKANVKAYVALMGYIDNIIFPLTFNLRRI